MNASLKVPRVNPNDDEVLLANWRVADGTVVKQGDVVCTIETTKSALDLEAPADGPLRQHSKVGVRVPVDTVIATIGEAKASASDVGVASSNNALISKPALRKMDELNVSADDLADLTTISVADVEAFAAKRDFQKRLASAPLSLKPGGLIIYGTGNAAFLVHDALVSSGREMDLCGFIDYCPRGDTHLGLPVIHRDRAAEAFANGVTRAIVAMPSPRETLEAMDFLEKIGFSFDNAVHAEAFVSPSAKLGSNVMIGARAHVGPLVTLGCGSRVLAMASIAHHSKLGQGAIVADGCILAGSVELADEAVLGIAVHANARVRVGFKARVATGCSLYENVPDYAFVRPQGGVEVKILS